MIKQIKQVIPNLFLNENLAIIGSSANLLNEEFGAEIDSFDEVVRFNRAPTEGWEKHVGSKTTLRVTNNHVFSNVIHSVGGDEDCPEWKPKGQPQYFIKELKNQKILLLNQDASGWEEKEKHIDPTSTPFLANYYCAEEFTGVYMPSVGHAFISLCIMNGIKPTLFGFGLEEKSNKASHYWEDKNKISSSHGYNIEREFIKIWHEIENLLIR